MALRLTIFAPSTALGFISLRIDATFVGIGNFAVGISVCIVLLRLADITTPTLKNIWVEIGRNVPVVATDSRCAVGNFDTTTPISVTRIELHQRAITAVGRIDVNLLCGEV